MESEVATELRNYGNAQPDQYDCVPVPQSVVLEAARLLDASTTETAKPSNQELAAQAWLAERFADKDDPRELHDVPLMELVQRCFAWGNEAWGAAGKEQERADLAAARVEALLANVRSERQLREEAERERDKAQDKWVADREALLAERDALANVAFRSDTLLRELEHRVAVLEAALRDLAAKADAACRGTAGDGTYPALRDALAALTRPGAVLAGGAAAGQEEA